MGKKTSLTIEALSPYRCEGAVVTCARCGRPFSECDGGCEIVIETRGHRVPSGEDLAAAR
jgi:hypothetical protein